MKRREFCRSAVAGSLALGLSTRAFAADSRLQQHRLAAIEFRAVKLPWPRHVGRNATKGHHGHGPTISACILKTDQGAVGWGHHQSSRKDAEALRERVIGQPVAAVFDPARGILDDALHPLDIPLHDLAGHILGQPVWKMMKGDAGRGQQGDEPFVTKVYSGMIYFDDLDPPDKPAGIDKVLENCRWDYEHGYRQFKIKIGRGHKWMAADAGLRRDIDVVRAVHDAFPDAELLVDGNNGFTVETIIQFLQGIDGVPLFWVEEPFHETVADWRKLAAWMKDHGYRDTYRADGEAMTDFDVLAELEADRTLTLRLDDICGYGFTRWRRLMPGLKQRRIAASPHTWGSGLKTVYTAHFAAAEENHPTLEGVTCLHDEVDFGENRIVDGRFQPSSQPGFGLTLLV